MLARFQWCCDPGQGFSIFETNYERTSLPCWEHRFGVLGERRKHSAVPAFPSEPGALARLERCASCVSWNEGPATETSGPVTCRVHSMLTGGAGASPVLSRDPEFILGIWHKICHCAVCFFDGHCKLWGKKKQECNPENRPSGSEFIELNCPADYSSHHGVHSLCDVKWLPSHNPATGLAVPVGC